MLRDFKKFGRALWEAGLIHWTSGNMSLRRGDAIHITRTGSSLADLSTGDLVRIGMAEGPRDAKASSETPVHRAIYRAFPKAKAVVHAHPPYATVLSLNTSEIIPRDSDSLYISRIPVLTDSGFAEGSACVASRLPGLMNESPVAVVRGHGIFVMGESLEQCIGRITMAENQCRLLYLEQLLKRS